MIAPDDKQPLVPFWQVARLHQVQERDQTREAVSACIPEFIGGMIVIFRVVLFSLDDQSLLAQPAGCATGSMRNLRIMPAPPLGCRV